MHNNLNIDSLDRYGMFRSNDVDDAHLKIAKNVSPHRIDVRGHKNLLDVNFKGIHLAGISLLHVYYGAAVEVKPDHSEYYFTQTTLAGNGHVTLGKDQCQTATGDTVVVSPSVPYKMTLEERCDRVAVGINPVDLKSHLSKLINSEVNDNLVFDLKVKNARSWLNTINYVLQQIADQPQILQCKDIQSAYTNLIISNLLELHNHNYMQRMNAKEDYMVCPQVKAAVDYIHGNIKSNISIADLAAFSNVSARTLQRNFIRHMDIAPIAYIRNAKLDAIHGELESITQIENGAIKRVLLDYGIVDFGRFAQYYRNKFNCTPKETLQRTIRNF